MSKLASQFTRVSVHYFLSSFLPSFLLMLNTDRSSHERSSCRSRPSSDCLWHQLPQPSPPPPPPSVASATQHSASHPGSPHFPPLPPLEPSSQKQPGRQTDRPAVSQSVDTRSPAVMLRPPSHWGSSGQPWRPAVRQRRRGKKWLWRCCCCRRRASGGGRAKGDYN